MPEHKGVVFAKSEHGILFKKDGPWFNFASESHQGMPFDAVEKGDNVRIVWSSYDKRDGSKGYSIEVIENLSNPVSEALPFEEEESMPGEPDPRAPSPFVPDATSEPVEAPGQDLWAKDRLKARTDCIACATGIYKSCIEAGVFKEFPAAEALVSYAATLELWAKSD